MGRLNKLSADISDIEQNPIRPSRLIGELNAHERSMLETRLACVSIVEKEFAGVCSKAAYVAITVLSDRFELVSVCRRVRKLMPNKADATRQEQRFGLV